MARLQRYSVTGYLQNVIIRSEYEYWNIFLDKDDILYYRQIIQDASVRFHLIIYAYALMPSQVHFLVMSQQEKSLSRVIQSVSRRYTQYFNLKYHRQGNLWTRNYSATVLEGSYFLKCCRYIETTPMRDGLVKHLEMYEWSSYHAHAYGQQDPLLKEHKQYSNLGQTSQQRQFNYYRFIHDTASAREIDEIEQFTCKGWVLGDEPFRAEIENVSGRRAAPLPRGRRPGKLLTDS